MQWWKGRRDRLEDEIQTHIEFEVQENIEAGMPPEEARHAALKKFGNVLLSKERSREIWGWLWLERLLQDLRYALRGLKNAPGYAATMVLTLALGLGSMITMLAIVDSVLLRPVALDYPEQLVTISGKRQQEETTYLLSQKQMEVLRHEAHSFSAVNGYNTTIRPVGTSDGVRMAVLTQVTPQLFNMLGIHAKLGRLLSDADEKAPVAIVSASYWQEQLQGNPKAIGLPIKISGQLRTVIGVLPEGIHFPMGTEGPMVYTPLSLHAKGQDDLFGDSAILVARMKPGVSMQQALAEVYSLFTYAKIENDGDHETLEIRSYNDYLTGDIQIPLLALLGGVGILLLIACANAMNLQIVRAMGRMEEISARWALGASFRRLLQQMVTESVVVSLFGATLGGALAYALIAIIRRTYGLQFPRFDELSVHPEVFATGALLALLVGALASLSPIFSIRRQTTTGKTTRHTTRRSRVPGMLVSLQIALTCVLLVTSGLLARTLRALQEVKLGFDPHGVTTLVLMPEDQHKAPEIARQTDARLLERFQALPGVQSATMQTSLPFSIYNIGLSDTTDVKGRAFHKEDTAFYSMVSSNFVQASGIHLIQGRGFLPQDDASAAMVALVNQAFVRKYLADRNPIGASLMSHRESDDKDSDLPFTQALTVVGVVENELQGGDLRASYQPMVYLDYLQLPKESSFGEVFSMIAQFAVRSSLPQAVLEKELRAAIKQVAPDMAEMSLSPMEKRITQSLNQRRLGLRLVTGFGGVALVLSAIGIYGVLAYAVALRRREIGIRMALGASRMGVTRLIARQAGMMVLLGIALGAVGAWASGHAVKSFLFGVRMLDSSTLGTVTILLLLVCAMAAILPALRAAQVDPVETLRAD